ncbi:flippase [Neobacillus cucumis]|uniref:flippase n=1 Tax=Neobacillus cucumis TaxID=1740721 RepID=UPI00203AE15D|nr:flippase [Neobacillus cucumis]MCM3727696.1 flippase [Neobacillus cucumis]
MKKNSIIGNAFYLFLGNVLVRFLTAASTILIARYLGAEDYGVLSIALAYASVAAYFTDLGLTHTLIREGTKEHSSIPILMSSFFRVRIILSLVTILFSILIIEFLYHDDYLKEVLYIVLIPTIMGAALQGVGAVYYQLIEKMHITAIIRTIAGLTTAIALIAGMIFKWPLLFIAPVYGLANVLAGLFSIFIVIKYVNIFKGWNKSILDGLFSFTISGLTIMLLPQIGPIVIEKASGLKEAGFFSAAYRIPSLLYQIPGVVAAAFYPVLFRLGNNQEFDKHLELNTRQLKIMSFLGISMAIPFLFFSKWWIHFLFGAKWEQSATPLSILALMVVLQSFNYPMADSLTTKGKQKTRTIIQLFALILGIVLYYTLSSKLGSTGGALAAVLIEGILFTCFSLFQKNSLRLLWNGGAKVLASFFIVCLLYWLTRSFIHPLIGSIGLDIIFIVFILLIDSEIKKFLFDKVISKLVKK